MLFPLSAHSDKIRLPRATLVLIGLNFLIYFFTSRLWGKGLQAFYDFFGLMPSRVLSPDLIIWYKTFPFLTSMFVHADLLHVTGNCLFLYVFGSELENRFGPRKYLYFYFLSGIYSGLFFVACHWQSPVGVIGASGAISGLMGAVLLLFPLAKIRLLFMSPFPFYARIIEVPAYICIGLWFLMQLAFGLSGVETGVAYWGHVGGFIGGIALSVLVLTRPFVRPTKSRKKNLLMLGRNRPAPRASRYGLVWDHARAIGAGVIRSKTAFHIVVGLFIVYVMLLANYYVFGISAQWAILYTLVESLFVLVPLVYFLFLNRAVHDGLSSFFGSFFSLLYEGRRDHEERPDIYKAESLERKEDYLGAVKEYRRIFARFPGRLDILYRIAEIYRNKLKDTRKAAGAYRALMAYPEEGRYAYCIRHAGEVIEALGRQAPEEPEPIGIDDGTPGDDFIVGRF
jgi:membrane associated rhomboid family serine protease